MIWTLAAAALAEKGEDMGDQALSTLLNMGFGFEESSAALEHCKKDVSEAVAYLTDPSR